MMETDLWMMTALTFLPLVFVLAIMFIPRGSVELIRWVALIGTAATFALSMVVFIGFYQMLDSTREGGTLPLHGRQTLLEERTDHALKRQTVTVEAGKAKGFHPPL